MKRSRLARWAIWILMLAGLSFNTVTGRDVMSDTFGHRMVDGIEAAWDELIDELTPNDTALIRSTHLSYIRLWDAVAAPRSSDDLPWRQVGDDASPVTPDPITALVDVPDTGEYRIYLRYRLDQALTAPDVALTIESMTTDAEGDGYTVNPEIATPLLEHVYGRIPLRTKITGSEMENAFPIRFDAEVDRIGTPSRGGYVWEYRDAELTRGVHRITLASPHSNARVHALLMTMSKDFRPSLTSAFIEENTLSRLYVRFRVVNSSHEGREHGISSGFRFHWRGRQTPDGEVSWGTGLESVRAIAGEWSPFIEATDLFPIPGPWSTMTVRCAEVPDGTTELQFAWHPSAAGVAHTIRSPNGPQGTRVRLPREAGEYRPTPDRPIWGVWFPANVHQAMTEAAVIARYRRWTREAADRLAVADDHPTIQGIRIFTGNATLPPVDREAYAMLNDLGVNWMPGAPADVVERYGFYDEIAGYNTRNPEWFAGTLSETDRQKVTKIKLGDEIATAASGSAIDGSPSLRAAFHAFLEEQARLYDSDNASFYGVSDLYRIDFPDTLDPEAGRFQRRLYYYAQRFRHLAHVPEHRRQIASYEEHFPNAALYNNYSPHPVFLTGASMNHTDWFVLPRHRAQTMAWGSDWAMGPWNLRTREQCVTFYAALVASAARKHGYPSGFYVGVNCYNGARKMFSCIGQGVNWLHLYTWGPHDAQQDGNAWSEHEGEYHQVMAATHALGPADRIVSEGVRQPRRAAILYNRTHEIWTGGRGRLNHDWMWSFIGLMSDQIPVEVIIEEDLTVENLAQYQVLYLGGFNLERHRLSTLRAWVEDGGLLIGAGGFAWRDEFNDIMSETVDLFGARPTTRDADCQVVRMNDEGLFPPGELQAHGIRFNLEPTSGHPVAHYADDHVAAVERRLGEGVAILLGFQPGLTFRHNGAHLGLGRAWHNAPPLAVLGRQRIEYSHPVSEAVLFEHDDGLAVLLTDFGRQDQPDEPALLSVRPDREISEVSSGLRRPLEWTRNGDRIDIRVPKLDPVDVIILR